MANTAMKELCKLFPQTELYTCATQKTWLPTQ